MYNPFVLVASGDYSDAQLLRVHRQALVLRRYYELLSETIRAYQVHGITYIVGALAVRAGKVLGEDAVAVSTVRLWHVEYVENKGKFRPDERGHYTRELLVMEEDIKNKFVKWSLGKAKHDDLSVEAAQDYLNKELLNTLEAAFVVNNSVPDVCVCPNVCASLPYVSACPVV